MAEIITKDSEEFKEITGWIKRTGRALERATARFAVLDNVIVCQ